LVRVLPFGRIPIKNQAAPAGAHLTYWGGPVISQIHVVAVFWGPNVNAAITGPGAIDQFFSDITNSRYYDLLTEYSTTGLTGAGVPATSSNQSIQRGVFDGKFTIAPASCAAGPCTITDPQIQAELRNQINAGHLPQPVSDAQGNVETFYMIYFPPGISISAGGVGSCVQGGFCAYHSNTPGTLVPKLVPYGVLPDFSAGGCSVGCGTGTLFQNVTAVTSHEMSEAVTDALVGSATATAPPLAWYDPDPAANPLAEIGDICGGQDVTTTAGQSTYTVQQEFSNVQNDCVSAPPAFALSLQAGGVPPGIATNMRLNIQSSAGGFNLFGYTGTVHFASSDPQATLPADYTFTATDSGSHTFPITLNSLGDQTISVADTRSAGFTGSVSTNVNTTPDLTITKTHSGNFAIGQSGSYAIVISNNGNGPSSGTVAVVDSLPIGLTATAISGTGWTCTLATTTCTRADALARGVSYPAIILTVNVGANAPSSVVNTAVVSGGGETNTANDAASDLTSIAAPNLVVRKTHFGPINGNFFQGEKGATYNIAVSNSGGAPTTAPITLKDTLPTGMAATALAGTGWACTLATLTCTRADVIAANGLVSPITLTVDIAIDAPASVTNVATVSGGGETITTDDLGPDPTTILPPPTPDLAISITQTAVFVQGQTGTYVISVGNPGTAATSGVVTMKEILPTGLSATSISGNGWNCVLSTLTCTRSDALAFNLAYPAITLNVNVAADAPASVTDSATVSGGGDSNPANNTATATTQVFPPLVDFTSAVVSASGLIQAQAGAGLVFNISNTGNIASSGVVSVSATLPAVFTATAIGGAGWACVVETLTCTRSDSLNASASFPPIQLTVNIAPSAADVTVALTVSGGNDGNPSNNTNNIRLLVQPAITFGVSPDIVTVVAGQPAKLLLQIDPQAPAGTVTFSCSGLPRGASCSFTPPSIQAGSVTSVDMTISTTTRGVSAPALLPNQVIPTGVFIVAFTAIFLALNSRARRTRLIWGLASATLLFSLCLGCGGSGGSAQGAQATSGTPQGGYAVNIVATGTSGVTASQTVQLGVR
jgi:uncharacterized repeat protein (TIGR01451 family)